MFVRQRKEQGMERGKIQSVGGFSGGGTISDEQGRVINFSNGSIVSRDRAGLKLGDRVWFERIGANLDSKAINIRKC